jgi:hypothetical protein
MTMSNESRNTLQFALLFVATIGLSIAAVGLLAAFSGKTAGLALLVPAAAHIVPAWVVWRKNL